jgi:hypothetical protein
MNIILAIKYILGYYNGHSVICQNFFMPNGYHDRIRSKKKELVEFSRDRLK